MVNISPRRLLTRAGTGAAVIALVALAGYSVGQTQSPQALVAASSPRPPTRHPSTRSGRRSRDRVVCQHRQRRRAGGRDRPGREEGIDGADRDAATPRRPDVPRVLRPAVPVAAAAADPRQAGLGSGVITTADGYILTNNHVIDGADRVRVELTDKRTFDAKVVGTDPASDLAVLKVDAQGLRTLADRRLEPRERRRRRARDWQPARRRPDRHDGHHQRQGTRDRRRRRQLRGLPPDRRGDQPGQLRRGAHQPERRARRHQLADPDADRGQHRPRVRDSVEHGASRDGPAEDRRQGQPRANSASRSRTSPRISPRASSSPT